MTNTNTKTYSAEDVKAMAEAKGLPCEILNSNGVKVIKPISTLEALGLVREWSRYWNPEDLANDSFDRIARSK